MSGNRSSSYGGGLVDPSNLHLKKELTQIRKAARALRDPGTTSSWRSPLTSSRSTEAVALPTGPASSSFTTVPSNHYHHHYRNSSGFSIEETGSNNNLSGGSNSKADRIKEKKVFLYNWRTQRSGSERSASVTGSRHQQRSNADDGIGDGEESVEDSLSDAPNGGDLKTNTADDHMYALSSSSKMFNSCRDATNLTRPPIRRASLMKKKPKKSAHSSAALNIELHRQPRLAEQSDSKQN